MCKLVRYSIIDFLITYMIIMIKPLSKLCHHMNVRDIVLKTEKYKNWNIGTYVLIR